MKTDEGPPRLIPEHVGVTRVCDVTASSVYQFFLHPAPKCTGFKLWPTTLAYQALGLGLDLWHSPKKEWLGNKFRLWLRTEEKKDKPT